jgi:phosphoglycerate kinase
MTWTPTGGAFCCGLISTTRPASAPHWPPSRSCAGGAHGSCSLLGQQNGPDPALSLRAVADHLGVLTGERVPLAPAVVGPQVRDLTERLEPGQMLMLENVRFEAGESRSEPALASALAELADLYVGDAFAAAHLPHASTWGVAQRLPCAAGRLMEREVHVTLSARSLSGRRDLW